VNNRMLELAIQSGLKKPHSSDVEYIGDFDWRMFGDLLIQDVVDILSTYRAKVRFDDGIEHNCQHPIYAIKKHFGAK